MSTIGVICAMEVEVKGLKDLMAQKEEYTYSKMTFTKGYIGNNQIVAVECGVGKVNAAMCAQVMIDKFSPDVIINSGVAGSVSLELCVGDMVVATKVVEHDMNVSALGDPLGEITFPDENRIYFPCDSKIVVALAEAGKEANANIHTGVIASGDIFISQVKQREKIADRFNALACEMEGAAIGHVCYRNDVPFCVFRAISDDLKQNEGVDFVTFCKMASEKSIHVMKTFIENF